MTAPAAAIVPVKSLALAKTRLATVLSLEERAALMLASLRTVLGALVVPEIAACFVVSPDPVVLARVAPDAIPVRQEPVLANGLNAGLREARARAEAAGAAEILVVPADLPLFSPADTRALLALADQPGTVVLAPDRHEAGTNALLLRPPGALPFVFGPGSLRHYQALAAARGLRLRYYRAAGTALDLDTPADLAALAGRSDRWSALTDYPAAHECAPILGSCPATGEP